MPTTDHSRHPAVTSYVALGSNLSDPVQQVRIALTELAGLPDSRLVAASRLYRTAPVGPAGQPDYVNAVACLETRLEPGQLLVELQAIELAHGRRRDGTRWGPRTLDLDILLYGETLIDEPGLRIPHPEMSVRAFVLIPLAEVAPPDLVLPDGRHLTELLAQCGREGIELLT